jgi:type I restriction enzyme, S subunit
MELRSDDKQTGVRGNPEDWEVKRVGSVLRFQVGFPFSSVFFNENEDGIRLVKNRDLKSDDQVVHYTGKYDPAFLVRDGDVLVGMDGDFLPCVWAKGQALLNQRVGRILPQPGMDRVFAYYYLRKPLKDIEAATSGTTVKHLSHGDIEDLELALPREEEQHAIATPLRDVDALLVGLGRLIAKKRDLKQAVMQQLLTGQTRLPGFHDEWQVRRLGDHVTFLRNGVNSRAELLAQGRVRYLHYGDIHACRDMYLSPDSLLSLPDAKAARLDRLRDGDLIFADASEDIAGVSKSVELRGIGNTEVVSGLHTIAARFDKTVLANGFKGFLQWCPPFATHLRRLAAGTKVYATNRAHIASVEMRLPLTPEQVAIAAVLSDMDAEISALEARRDKTRGLKQAMMQELLTGKTRLVSTGGAGV